jgi:multidrug efflux pump subunit AcrB
MTPRGRAAEGPPLHAIGYLELNSQVAAISRLNGRKMNSVKAYITAGILPARVANELKDLIAESKLELPPGYTLEFAGEGAERDEAVHNLIVDITIIVSLIIVALVCSFQSFRISGIIFCVGVLSMGLGFASLWLFDFPFGFMAILGIMGLVGIAINDAIVVMAGIRETADAREGKPEAIADVIIHRSRHVLTTSLTTMAGFIPLVLGGGEFWPPVAIVIAGGVAGATILALYFVPSLYLLIVANRFFRKRKEA